MPAKAKKSKKTSKRNWILLLVFALIMYVVVPQFTFVRHSLSSIQSINPGFALLAIAAVAATYLAGGFNYKVLAFKKIGYLPTVLIQLAATFANRLLPAGIGSIGVNYEYLVHRKHSEAQAAAVVAMNNTLGFIGHIILAAIFLIFSPAYLSSIHLQGPDELILAIVAVLLLGYLVASKRIRRKIARALSSFAKQFLEFRKRPGSLAAALAGSIALTLFNLLGFLFCLWAFNVHLSLAEVFIAFTFGVAAATAIPTPGGIGAAEAGFTAGLVAFGLASGQALAIVLLYRLIYFWLALVSGGVALFYARRFGYL